MREVGHGWSGKGVIVIEPLTSLNCCVESRGKGRKKWSDGKAVLVEYEAMWFVTLRR
jgi:hypothetical protein